MQQAPSEQKATGLAASSGKKDAQPGQLLRLLTRLHMAKRSGEQLAMSGSLLLGGLGFGQLGFCQHLFKSDFAACEVTYLAH